MFAYLPNTATFVCYMAPFPLDMSHAMPSHCPPSEPTSDDGNSPKTADRNTTLLFDEWTDERGVPVLAIIAHVGGRLKFCIDVAFLEGKGPQRGVEHKEIAGALLSSLATAQIHPDRINFVISDEGSTVVAAAKHVLQHVWRNARWFLCWSHKLAGIGSRLLQWGMGRRQYWGSAASCRGCNAPPPKPQ